MGHDPLGVHAVAMEPAADLVVDATQRHAGEGSRHHLASIGGAGGAPAIGQQEQRGWMGKLGLGAEAAVRLVEHPMQQLLGFLEYRAGDLTALGPRRFSNRPSHGARLRGNLGTPVAPCGQYALQYRAKPGPPEAVVGREVGASKERLAAGIEKYGEGPATLAGQRLDSALVTGIHVGPLVAIHLDAGEAGIQQLGDAGVLVGLPIHHMAPMAPYGTDVEQDGAIASLGLGERLRRPCMPVDRLVRRTAQIG